MALNKIIIMGRLTRDPELRKTYDGTSVTSFTLAVDRDVKDKETGTRNTDFIECVAWRGTAEFVTKYFKKGSMAVVSGRLQNDDYTGKDGVKRRVAEIIVESIYFGESNSANRGPEVAENVLPGGGNNEYRGAENGESNQTSGMFGDEEPYEDDYKLPF